MGLFKNFVEAIDTQAWLDKAVYAVSSYLEKSPNYKELKILPDKEFSDKYKNDTIFGGVAAITTYEGHIHIREGYEGDVVHELVHASGMLPHNTTESLNEGVTQSAALKIGKKYNLPIRETYATEVREIEKYLIPTTRLSHQEFMKSYAAASDKAKFLTDAVWKRYGNKFADTSDWGKNPKQNIYDNFKNWIGPGNELHYLVDELKVTHNL